MEKNNGECRPENIHGEKETSREGRPGERAVKADIHLHLDGSLSPELAAEFLKEEGERPGLLEVKGRLTVPPECRSLTEYLRCFELPLKLLQKPDRLERAAEELILRLGRQGLTYAEIRFAPQLHLEMGMTQHKAVEAVLAGMRSGLRECPGLEAGLLLCMMVTGEERANEETEELCAAMRGEGVAGLDLAGAEGAVPMERFRALFGKARREGVPFTIHAGECGDAENIKKAVSFGAARIGHGCDAIRDRECMELLRREGIVLEMCPTSNVQTRAVRSMAEHPIRTFFDRGIRVTVNTDNMTVSGTDLEREYALLKAKLGFTDGEIEEMNRNARRAGFLPAGEK